jgi:hypothetical protein
VRVIDAHCVEHVHRILAQLLEGVFARRRRRSAVPARVVSNQAER